MLNEKYYFACTRFSLFSPNSSSWKASNLSHDDYIKYLFDSERLNVRFSILEKYSLPLLEQSSMNFKFIHILQYSPLLPDIYKKRLFDLLSQYDFLRIQEVSNENPHLKFLSLVENKIKTDNCKIFGYFYLDDDDLISIDYFAKSYKYLDDTFIGYHVSYGLGLTGFFDGSEYQYFKKVYYPKLNIGILRVCSYDSKKFVYPKTGPHTLIDQKSPIVLDSTEISWLWTRHKNQDTGINKENSNVINDL